MHTVKEEQEEEGANNVPLQLKTTFKGISTFLHK